MAKRKAQETQLDMETHKFHRNPLKIQNWKA